CRDGWIRVRVLVGLGGRWAAEKGEALMRCTRRDLGFLLSTLMTLGASAQSAAENGTQTTADNSVEKLPKLGTKAYRFDELPVVITGQNRQRRLFTGKTHTGFKLESHQSDVAPGEVNHPPHQHLREEMMLVREGTMELTVSGQHLRLGP